MGDGLRFRRHVLIGHDSLPELQWHHEARGEVLLRLWGTWP